MSEENITTDEQQTQDVEQTPETNSTAAEETPNEGDDKRQEELPPEVLREKLTRANAEAAKYRTQLRETQEKLKNAKTIEEFNAAVEELTKRNAELEQSLLRNEVARTYKLPNELAEVLKGATKEELEAHAKKLQKFAVIPEESGELRGGLDPSDNEGDFDPVKEARKARAYRY